MCKSTENERLRTLHRKMHQRRWWIAPLWFLQDHDAIGSTKQESCKGPIHAPRHLLCNLTLVEEPPHPPFEQRKLPPSKFSGPFRCKAAGNKKPRWGLHDKATWRANETWRQENTKGNEWWRVLLEFKTLPIEPRMGACAWANQKISSQQWKSSLCAILARD